MVQPVSWAVMVSLAAVWESLGVRPDAVLGHSQGEIAAACVSGALSLEDAARVVALRSLAIAGGLAGRGGMMSVPLPLVEVEARLAGFVGRLEVAAVNGPSSVVVAGEPAALQELLAQCEGEGVRARVVPVDYASHTSHVELIEAKLAEVLAGLAPRVSRVPFFSTVEGRWLDTTVMDGGYWYRNLRQTVRFADATAALAGEGFRTFVEVSSHPVLVVPVQEALEGLGSVVTGTLRRNDGGLGRVLASVAEVFVRGVAVDWAGFFEGFGVRRVDLPTYAFQRQRFWLESSGGGVGDVGAAGLVAAGHPLMGAVVELPQSGGVLATARLSLKSHAWLADHAVSGVVLVPGTALVELVVRAGDEVGASVVEELVIEAPLVVPGSGAVRVQVVVGGEESGRRAVSVHSRVEGAGAEVAWVRHVSGFVVAGGVPAGFDLGVWPPVGAVRVDVEDFYPRQFAAGYEYGPVFQGLRSLWKRGGEVFAEVVLGEGQQENAAVFGLHPALFDAALHAGTFCEGAVAAEGETLLPFAWNDVTLHATGATALRVHISRTAPDAVSIELADGSGAPVATVGSLVTRAVSAEQLQAATAGSVLDSLFRVDWSPLALSGGEAGELPLLGEDFAAVVAAKPELVLFEVDGQSTGAERARELVARTLGVLQTWLAEPELESSRLVVATRGAVAVHGPGELTDPAAAAVWGLVRTAQSENPDRIVLVDLDRHPDSATALARAVRSGEPQLALRAGTATVPRLVRTSEAELGEARPLDPRGTVLITGGTGVLGALTARHLVAEYGVRNLLLTSRRGGAAEGAADLLADLAELGAEVTIAAVDAADRDQLAALLAGIPAERPLTAVVHTAGVLDDGILSTLTPERLETVFRPKVDAVLNLHELTADLDLAAFVLFSSAAGVLGNAGQANYAAANAFLDAVAQQRRAEGRAATSLAWGLWAQPSGMTGHLVGADQSRMTRGGALALSSVDGMDLFDAALRTEQAALVPARMDFAALRGQAAAGQLPALFGQLVRLPRQAAQSGTASTQPLVERLTGLPEADQIRALLDLVRGQAATVLGGFTALDAEQAFKDVGFDSLTAVELRNRLTAATGVRLPATLVFDYPTPAALARHLRAELLPDGGAGDLSDAREGELRRALAAVPISRFRELGLLDALLRLAADADGRPEAQEQAADETELIAAMDVDDLVQRALSGISG